MDGKTFLLTADPGLEDVVVGEIRERCPEAAPGRDPGDPAGRLRVRATAIEPLLRLRTIHHVVELRGETEITELHEVGQAMAGLDFDELESAASFRVSSSISEAPELDRVAVQRAAGGVLHDRYGTRVDLEGFELDVRVDVRGSRMTAGIQRTRDSLGNRVRRGKALRSSLKPTIAAAMLRLGGAHRRFGKLIDPMCGAAVIPVEAAALGPDLEISASDWDTETVEVARQTLRNHQLPLEVQELDARSLGSKYPGHFEFIVTDPPYGLRQARRAGLNRLYRDLLTSFERALTDDGRLVMIVVKYRLLEAALEHSNLTLLDTRTVSGRKLQQRIYVLERKRGTRPFIPTDLTETDATVVQTPVW